MKSWIRWTLIILVIAVTLRFAFIYRSRHQEAPRTKAAPLNADYYVTPKKLHAYDLKSARQLVGMAVWVREGYRFYYYPVRGKSADLAHEAGLLGPIEKLDIRDVFDERSSTPAEGGIRLVEYQVMAAFDREGKRYAFPIGLRRGNDYQIYADEILYIQDPRQLYQHWSADVWQAIDQHQMKPGMNELQAAFAIGMGTPEPQRERRTKVVHYPNAGHPLTVTYQDGIASTVAASPGT